ncbi:FG-GAP repeat domain-containing protein [Streptomyces collinus]|uniref:FG-GAP repeat domain-containing protein n=1 Tax=Streptomyces collinus TaxID=42684 RepID=UPI00369F08E7
MGRHAPRRRGTAVAVSSFAVAVAAVSAVVLPGGGASAEPSAPAAGTTEITLTDPSSTRPRTDRPLVAGASGFLHRQSGIAGLLWTDRSTGTTVVVGTADGAYAPVGACESLGSTTCPEAWYGSDGDLVALPQAGSVSLWDPATRTTSVFTSDQAYRGLAGRTVLTERALHDRVDGTWRSRALTPAGTRITSGAVKAADAHGALFQVGTDLYHLDTGTAVATEVFEAVGARPVTVMSDDRVGVYDLGSGDLRLKPRTDPGGAEQVLDLPSPGGYLEGAPVLVGDWLLLPLSGGIGSGTGVRLTAVSLTDGSSRTLLAKAGAYAVRGSGDSALVTGGTDAADWWTQRVSQSADGSLTSTKAAQVPAPENAKTGLALSRGSLRVAEEDPSGTMDTTSVRTLATTGGALTASEPQAGDRISPVCPYAGADCSVLWGNSGDGPRDAFLTTYDDPEDAGTDLGESDRLVAMKDGSSGHTLEFRTRGGTIVDVSDGYAVYNSGGTSPAQYVGEFGQGQKLKRSVRAAALNGSTLWSATTTAGRLTPYDIATGRTGATATVPGLGCVPDELQAAGRWVYWACGDGPAGVYDTKAGTSRAVTGGDVLLGDGFTVRHDHAADTLVLTEAATGTTRVIATTVQDIGLAVDRRFKWTVDEYTGLVAWTDVYERTHVATTGVTPSAVTAFESQAPSHVAPGMPFEGSWLLSRPVTSWSVTFTSVQSGATGRVSGTITGGASSARVATNWYGTTATNVRFPTGMFTWTLKATGTGTAGAVTVASGEGFLSRGAAVRHDFTSPDGPDGRGDLLTLNSSGGLTFQAGTGTGRFGDKTTGSGWATSVRAVPFGDLSGDRCNDVLVRLSSGALRLYKPGCGKAVTPKTSYTTLASSGWTQYDVLTSPGDVTGDGRPDLVSRASTGTVYLHKGTADGRLAARVKLYDDWKGYKKVIGAGDLNGDGIGDLLAQDKANTLYRYDGRGNGTFAARAKVFADWGASYNAVVGVGDLTDDGRADLVSRDSGGNVYRNSGDGKGSFGARTKIATGWGAYKSLS